MFMMLLVLTTEDIYMSLSMFIFYDYGHPKNGDLRLAILRWVGLVLDLIAKFSGGWP